MLAIAIVLASATAVLSALAVYYRINWKAAESREKVIADAFKRRAAYTTQLEQELVNNCAARLIERMFPLPDAEDADDEELLVDTPADDAGSKPN